MKKTIVITLAIALMGVACKTNKTASSASTEIPTDAQLTAVKARFPDATKEELQKGHAVYTGACTRCHGTKDITGYTEEKLLGIVDVMAKKAKLSPDDKQALTRFAIGVRATSN
jgi:hypothetical protein